eukprot:TRINITY_DN17123_c0_g1_i1.p1 TRINITY_DN17123_c0_g1~~TRINITY_DN17123_c0_g1_i1.p1  ORF type:complete len:169 (-),score=41.15 TRINITY_DN17123_c0_g1_i1:101-607(-)
MKDMAKFLTERIVTPHNMFNFTLLHLGGNEIDDTGAKILAEGLKNSKTLTRLHIPYNKLTGVGAKVIVENLPKQLEVLNLSRNPIKEEGVKAVIEMVKKRDLTALYLDNCSIPIKEGLELARKCKELDKIKYLYMRENFTDAGEENRKAIKECSSEPDRRIIICPHLS